MLKGIEMAKKKKERRLGQSITSVTKIIVYPQKDYNGRPRRTIVVECEDGYGWEFQLSGFKKNIPVVIRKNFRGL